ncbi:MAG: prolyl oligopeptidase family serine peptidase [Gammaproteobacteria bacterium]
MRDLTDEDVAAWSRMNGDPALTPDGRWLAYVWLPYERTETGPRVGSPLLIIRSTASDDERRIPLGSDPVQQFLMSPGGGWIAIVQADTQPDSSHVTVVETTTGEVHPIGPGEEVKFLAKDKSILVRAPDGAPDAKVQTNRLTVYTLESLTASRTWEHVGEYAVSSLGDRIALAQSDGLRVCDLNEGVDHLIEPLAGATQLSALRWSPSGRALALTAEAQGTQSLLVFNDPLASHLHRESFTPAKMSGFPTGFRVAGQPRSLDQLGPFGYDVVRWRDNEDGLFFQIERTPTAKEDAAPKVALWHSKDPYLPGQRAAGTPDRYLSFLSLEKKTFVRLADEHYTDAFPQDRGQFALAYAWKHYGVANWAPARVRGLQTRDYVLVDLWTGEKTKIAGAEGLKVPRRLFVGTPQDGLDREDAFEPHLSPDGRSVVFLSPAGDYFVYDTLHHALHNVTEHAPGWRRQPPFMPSMGNTANIIANPQGWSADNRHLFISDEHDIWALPMDGSVALNITGNGSSDNLYYNITDSFGPTGPDRRLGYVGLKLSSKIDLKKPVYFHVIDGIGFRSGLAVRDPGAHAARVLVWETAQVTYYKAENASVYIAQREHAVEGRNFFRLDTHWQRTRQLTDLAPQLREFRWISEPQYLSFKTPAGRTSHALLVAPIHPAGEKPFPTIVAVYGGVTIQGGLYSLYNVANDMLIRWARRGYAVLMPDIRPEYDEAGPIALDTVQGAVAAAAATGVVDANRLGLTGASFGGYESFYIASRSNLFKAVVPICGVSNLQSFYNGVVMGVSGAAFSEKNQTYLSGPWWQKPEVFENNSPMSHVTSVHTPMLIAHGDADTSVPFAQSVEMFNALRRLGDREVVLLQYVGGQHDEFNSNPDFQRRQLEFFDHYLRGAPAPRWWTEGLGYADGQTPAVAGGDANK